LQISLFWLWNFHIYTIYVNSRFNSVTIIVNCLPLRWGKKKKNASIFQTSANAHFSPLMFLETVR
jgi:hypothetical protein